MAMQDERFLDLTPDGVLRVPGTLWLGMWVLARQWALLVLGACSLLVGATDAAALAHKGLSWIALLIQAPVVFLLVAGAQRQPDGPAWARWIWRRGPFILGITTLLGFVWLGHWLWNAEYWSRWPELFFASAALLDLAIASEAWRSPYIRAVFQEFPEKKA